MGSLVSKKDEKDASYLLPHDYICRGQILYIFPESIFDLNENKSGLYYHGCLYSQVESVSKLITVSQGDKPLK